MSMIDVVGLLKACQTYRGQGFWTPGSPVDPLLTVFFNSRVLNALYYGPAKKRGKGRKPHFHSPGARPKAPGSSWAGHHIASFAQGVTVFTAPPACKGYTQNPVAAVHILSDHS